MRLGCPTSSRRFAFFISQPLHAPVSWARNDLLFSRIAGELARTPPRVWWRNVIGIRLVGRLRSMPGASSAWACPALQGGADACHPPERPHHACCPRRDRPLRTRAHGVLAQRYGVSTETIRKWRQRGPADCQDRSARPHKLPWKASEEERAIVCALRRSTGFPLDDLTFVVTHFLPHLNRDAVYRILKAEGLNRLPPSDQARKPHGTLQGLRGRLRAPRCEAPAQAAGQGWRDPQAISVRCHRPLLALGSPGREGRRDHRLRRRLPEGGDPSLSLPGHARAHRPGLLLRGGRLRGGLPQAEGGAQDDTALSRLARTGWWSASTGACSGRCWASRSTATAISRSCFTASTGPTMPGDSGCWAASRPTRRCDDGSRPSLAWPAGATSHRQTLASCPRPSWSSQPPRTSRIQTTGWLRYVRVALPKLVSGFCLISTRPAGPARDRPRRCS